MIAGQVLRETETTMRRTITDTMLGKILVLADARQPADAERSAGSTTATADDQRYEPVASEIDTRIGKAARKTPHI